VAAGGGKIHVVWLDSRHERGHNFRAIFFGGQALEQNLELYYRSRDDSESNWSKELLLSRGIDFVFAPEIAVDGENVVVMWAGYQGDKGKTGDEYHPSDIYFTTSRTGGKSWAPVARVTNNAKLGLASCRPHVAMYNGMIYLLYVEGRPDVNNVGVGLPVLIQFRPFPAS
jgi:hypothetical protein